jgi:TolB-like protein
VIDGMRFDLRLHPFSHVALRFGHDHPVVFGNQKPVRTLGKDLGIRWAVQGAVRRAGDQVRMNVSLADLSTGRDVWSDRFDGDRMNLAALQDQITARLASLNVGLIQAESRRS